MQARLLARLNETRRILAQAYDKLNADFESDVDVGPAGEWLLDNYYVVQEHIREVHQSLPRSYYHELPQLETGPLAGFPRVYEIAITLISHSEARIDIENTELFVGAFQESSPLSIGELWAIPVMLRLGLIESMRRMARRTVDRLTEIEEAEGWVKRIQLANEDGSSKLSEALQDFISEPHSFTPVFVSRFLHGLRMATGAFPPLAWLEQWIADEGLSFDDAAARSTERLALTQIMMANSITSLRAIGRRDWRAFVERQSRMEVILRSDPSGYYPRMTFATRDQYRHVVEAIGRRSNQNENDVASTAVGLAREAKSRDLDDERSAHVGYYLIDRGRKELERATGYRPSLRERLANWILEHPSVVYASSVSLATLALLAIILSGSLSNFQSPISSQSYLLCLLFILIPASDVAISLINHVITALIGPKPLPRLDLADSGIPPDYRTAVVMPTLFGNIEDVRDALEKIEVQFLANRGSNLHFALLSDFTDWSSQDREVDSAIVAAAVDGVRALNAQHAGAEADAFFLFHRPRKWNESEGVFMGWERKRGKLEQFNRFLRGGALDAFTVVEGDTAALGRVRYVITLDSDTMLPPDAAPSLIGALAHPLNRGHFDPAAGRVTAGYGILQPRVEISITSSQRSRFAAIHSGHPGVDPYTTAVSDVYQDLFLEGSFTGKGIYDVDVFENATKGRFPENSLLSHDLIEGNFARAGLVTDVSVFDDYPTRYLTFTTRKHRWIRGDWQLLRWLMPRVPGPAGLEPNRLSWLSRWKLFDNLRRSTVELALLALLIAGWTLLPGSPWRWTLIGLTAIAAPWLISLSIALVRPPLDKSWRAYYHAVGQDVIVSVEQFALAFTFLPHQAWISADAIGRTLFRLFFSRRKLLEWQTASQTEVVAVRSPYSAWRKMWPAAVLPVALLTVPGLLLPAGPLIAIWLAAPAIANLLNRPPRVGERRLEVRTREAAMRYALLHWRFFDRFVTENTHGLAPDNFQDDPVPVVAMRTSPTNIGLQLLATASAYDLGFLSVEEMTQRLELAFRSLERMRRLHGHFFNWYDLIDLRVLEPGYISTVDSGNLAGHLMSLRQACLSIVAEPVYDARVWSALAAALHLVEEQLRTIAATSTTRSRPALNALHAVIDVLREVRERGVATSFSTRRNQGSRPSQNESRESALNSLIAVARSVENATQLLHESIATPGDAGSAAEWLGWCTQLISHHVRNLQSLPIAMQGNGSSPSVAFPSLRELSSHLPAAAQLVARVEAIAARAHSYAMEMDFSFLYDSTRKLLTIGYNSSNHCFDSSHYDLLASEARLASFIAVAKNDVPVDHWFRLGRALTRAAGETTLVSWSGSMFEYMMPGLVMRSFPLTLLGASSRGAVRRQIAYGTERGVPWGVSESAYNVRDRSQTYQYRAFGVPDLGLKRGLGRELVVAPYASALAAMIAPEDALRNLAVMEGKGALGPYGFRDSLDYTRPDPGARFALVRTFMAHHIGMTLVALTNALLGQRWQQRFHSDPMVRSAELLLHERVPRRLVLQESQTKQQERALPEPELERAAVREFIGTETREPHIALLGHLPYTIMVTNDGNGWSHYEGLSVTRFRADGTSGNTGQYCYIKNTRNSRVWSASHQPTGVTADWYRAHLAADRITFHRADGNIETRTEIVVVPDDSAEVRRTTLVNNSNETRELELTSYGEIVLATPASDRAHPAFSKLFVETEWHEWCTAISATRRPRSATEQPLWCFHVVDNGADRVGAVSFETDRARFIGRGRSTRNPAAVFNDGVLSGTVGAVLDPIFALRTRVRLEPGQSSSVSFTTLVATNRVRGFELAGRYHDAHSGQRALDLAWTSAQIELRELGITPADAAVFQEIAGYLLFPAPELGASEDDLQRNNGSVRRLWANGISGDWPILLASIDTMDGLATLRQLLAAHLYWRRHGMTVDLVILNTLASTYMQELNGRVTEALLTSGNSGAIDHPGGVFLRSRDQMSAEDLLMLSATARVHITCDGRGLGHALNTIDQPDSVELEADRRAKPSPHGAEANMNVVSAETPATSLRFDNGTGGLTETGDYEIRVRDESPPPAPWVNVIANSRGGFVVSERGAGYTWVDNSHFFRLTPWHNDPVSDPASDVIYLRDEDSGAVWSATPAPVRSGAQCRTTHSPGTSTFELEHSSIASHLTLGIANDDPVKVSLLRLTNLSTETRRISVTAYVEWTLGVLRENTRHQVRTEFDASRGAIFARNPFDPDYSDWVAFCALSEKVESHTADRREFLGRNGDVALPQAIAGGTLAGATGSGLDPCAALSCVLELRAGETREMAVLLGAASDTAQARILLDRNRDRASAQENVGLSARSWSERLSVVQVRTPDPAFDAMLNRWSLYQALACRMWGRSALYQSSGAYGFRDQLQDAMAFVYADPGVSRRHIVRAAGRQFVEGDVQHWWHTRNGNGIRTRYSDDLVWLPYVVDHYLRVSGDWSLLSEEVMYLDMRQLASHEHELYEPPRTSDQSGSIYDHCIRALNKACTTGAHGLPLIGGGDWNDGMNRVGIEGKGESVWLAWFLVKTLRSFAVHAEQWGDAEVARIFLERADSYVAAIEENAWDGEWYRRAWFDDGTPLGSAQSDECRIDSLAQSWSVISEAGMRERQHAAMQSLEKHLVRDDQRLIMLLTPPFDKTANDPGYIKGYVPGVRENGAQYTHAALWAVLATTLLGQADRAFELFQMMNPLTHGNTPQGVARYKVEPYVIAADVYTADAHLGRGGWTWYTGAASWFYRVGLENILGFTKRGDTLSIKPCVPTAWPGFKVEYRYGGSKYVIEVQNPTGIANGGATYVFDGRELDESLLHLVDDGAAHNVVVRPKAP